MSKRQKLEKLCNEANSLISKSVTTSSEEFVNWKTATEYFLIREYGESSYEYKQFKKINYSLIAMSSTTTLFQYVTACRNGLIKARALLTTFLENTENEDVPSEVVAIEAAASNKDYSKVFIVHGHDGALKHEVARLIEKQGIEAIILSEQANEGATVIEKIERYSDVDAAICLFTPDDLGKEKNDEEPKFRARQNVVFETGYFMAKLRRENVILISEKDVELPSDLQGVMYTNTAEWKPRVLLELKQIGYRIDFNKLYEL